MIEWIVLIWTVANPLFGFSGAVIESKLGKRPPQVFVSSSTVDFTAKWETLSADEKKAAQIYVGKKSIASVVITPDSNISSKVKYCNSHTNLKLYQDEQGKWICPSSGVEIYFPIEK